MKVSRDMERQQVAGYQMDLFTDYLKRARPDRAGESGTESGLVEERQMSSVTEEQRALTFDLMDRAAELGNLEKAVRKVRRNKGAPGVDGMEVGELVVNSVDAHLYHVHFDAAKIWLDRFDKILDDNHYGEQGLHHDMYKLVGCKAKISINDMINIDNITADDINITNYEPQGFIKAPLLT